MAAKRATTPNPIIYGNFLISENKFSNTNAIALTVGGPINGTKAIVLRMIFTVPPINLPIII